MKEIEILVEVYDELNMGKPEMYLRKNNIIIEE